ncbi:MAG: DUF2478 domain-containing protein [Alphaproteobacteria bacterium]|nr:MAG: DUF2478 domain-containing protein [Alphaproteobacteria bacterium]
MRLAHVTVPGRGRTDALIARAVDMFLADGLRVAGVVCARPPGDGAHPCDMDLRVLPDGFSRRISQPLGRAARGCRLDGAAIEAMAAAVGAGLAGADLLVVNKFGRLEAAGRGLCGAIAQALEMEIPVLVGVNRLNLPHFEAFAGGMAVRLEPGIDAIRAWFAAARAGALPGPA